MRKGKGIVFLLTLALLALAGLCFRLNPVTQLPPSETAEENVLFLEVSAGGETERISLWKDDSGNYCVFLPGYAQLPMVKFRVSSGYSVSLDGQPVTDQMSCEEIVPEKTYEICVADSAENRQKGQITFYRADAVPAMYIDVHSGSMTYIHQSKENEEPGTMRIYLPDGTLDYRGDLEAVKGRGNATWTKDKKPYALQLRSEGDLLDMGQARNWILLANTYDPSHLRNKTVYEAAQALGLRYSPECRFVDLYLNGEYAGLYLLTEKIEIHSQRVDIPVTAGNLISIEKKERLWEYGRDQFVTPGGTAIRIRSTGNPDALQQRIQAAERAILAQDGVDPVTGKSYLELIDLESWAKKYLIEEVFGNLDAGYISQFFYWEDTGKIFAGPVWDYDVSMGNPDSWQLQSANMLFAGRPHLENWEDRPWFYALSQKEAFWDMVSKLYVQQMRPVLEEYLDEGILLWQADILASAGMDQLRWNGTDPQAAAEQMLDYMRSRMAFLDSLWMEENELCTVQLYINWHVIACYAVPAGSCIPEQSVPGGTDEIWYVGWFDADTQAPFDFSQPITQNKRIFLKEEYAHTTQTTASKGGLSGRIAFVPVTVLGLMMLGVAAANCKRSRLDKKERKIEKPAQPEKSRR